MSAKDPAILFFISNWLTSTAEMDSDVRGWYLNLILHQADKNGLPNDLDTLAILAGVKPKEYQNFLAKWEHVLKHKFKQNESGRLENSVAKEILRAREDFKEQRSKSGTVGYCMKIAYGIKEFKNDFLEWLKEHLYSLPIEEINLSKDKHVLEHMLKQKHKLYINTIKNINTNKDSNNKEDLEIFEKLFENFRKEYPGNKNGLSIEFKNFQRHKDWMDSVPKLLPGLENLKIWMKQKEDTGWKPQWKNLSTWINQRCWEQELEEIKIIRTKGQEAQNSTVFQESTKAFREKETITGFKTVT